MRIDGAVRAPAMTSSSPGSPALEENSNMLPVLRKYQQTQFIYGSTRLKTVEMESANGYII